MPRTARLYAPNTVHHITAGFVNGEFRMRGPRERDEYLRRLAAALRRTDWKLLSYVLMSSHAHLGAESGETPVQELMLSLQGGFGGWINVVHGRSGPVWADRFYEIIGDAASFAAHMITYHHNNPVRADVVDSPEQSDWSSHAAYLDPLRRPSFLDVRRGLELCGFEDDAGGRAAFHRFTLERIAVGRIEWMKPEWVGRVLSRARRASGLPVEAGQPHVLVGSDDPRAEQFEVEVPLLVAAASARALRVPLRPAETVAAACELFGVREAAVRGRSGSREVREVRRAVVWAHVHLRGGVPAEIARELNRLPTAASQIMARLRVNPSDSAHALAARIADVMQAAGK